MCFRSTQRRRKINPNKYESCRKFHRTLSSDQWLNKKKRGRPVNKTSIIDDTDMGKATSEMQQETTRGRGRSRKIAACSKWGTTTVRSQTYEAIQMQSADTEGHEVVITMVNYATATVC